MSKMKRRKPDLKKKEKTKPVINSRINPKTYSDWFNYEIERKKIEKRLTELLVQIEKSSFFFQKKKFLHKLQKYIATLCSSEEMELNENMIILFDEVCSNMNFLPRLYESSTFSGSILDKDFLNVKSKSILSEQLGLDKEIQDYFLVFEGCCLLSSTCNEQLTVRLKTILSIITSVHIKSERTKILGLDLIQILLFHSLLHIVIFFQDTGPDNILTILREQSYRASTSHMQQINIDIHESDEDDMSHITESETSHGDAVSLNTRIKCLELILMLLKVLKQYDQVDFYDSLIKSLKSFLSLKLTKELVNLSTKINLNNDNTDIFIKFLRKNAI